MPLFLILINLHRTLERSQPLGNYANYIRFGSLNKGLLKSELANFEFFTFFYIVLFGLDFLLAIFLFHKGTSFMGMEDSIKYSHLLRAEISHPYFTYVIFILVVSISFGI